MTEDPRGRGYPNLAKPESRVSNVWRQMWTELLVSGPTKAHRAQVAVQGVRRALARRAK